MTRFASGAVILACGLLLLHPIEAFGDETAIAGFSGDLFEIEEDGRVKYHDRLFVHRSGFRVTFNGIKESVTFIIDVNEKSTIILNDTDKEYLVISTSENYRIFFALLFGGSDTCSANNHTEIQATHTGSDAIAGRAVEQWRCDFRIDDEPEFLIMWIDPDLQFPIQTKDQDGEILRLLNIEKGPLPVSLFQAPNDYSQCDKITFDGWTLGSSDRE